jgi:hypothetical protein
MNDLLLAAYERLILRRPWLLPLLLVLVKPLGPEGG